MFSIKIINFCNICELKENLKEVNNELVIRINIFASENYNYASINLIYETLSELFPKTVLSFVSIPLLKGDFAAEFLIYSAKDEIADIDYKKSEVFTKSSFKFNEYELLYYSFEIDDFEKDDNIKFLTNELLASGISTNNIIRQWNYIKDITKLTGGDTNYNKFNTFRKKFYDIIGNYELPAATGIGCNGNNIIELLCYKGKGINAVSLENPNQIPASKYSEKVYLQENKQRYNTPLFSRAKFVHKDSEDFPFLFISGTASIFGELSQENQSVEKQYENTILNIKQLLDINNLPQNSTKSKFNSSPKLQLNSLRVYLKNPNDANIIRKLVEQQFSGLDIIFLLSDVCRDELLIEIEAAAS